jgi:hypothetical protein
LIDGRPPRDVVAKRIREVVKERLHPEHAAVTEGATP